MESVRQFESMLVVRGQSNLQYGSTAISSGLQAYGVMAGDSAPFARVDEAYGKVSFAGGWTASGGIERYPGQYSYYWNPTFPAQAKTDLSRPDYFAAGVPAISLSRTLGTFTPRLMCAWKSGQPYAGIQTDAYLHGVEAYVNAFWSNGRERSVGVGLRGTISGWTLHLEGGPAWKNQRLYPNDPVSIVSGSSPALPAHPTSWRVAAGVNRVTGSSGLLTLEYLHDSGGLSSVEFNSFAILARNNPGIAHTSNNDSTIEAYRAGMLRQNHLYAGYTRSTKKWRFGVRQLLCADDGSGYVQPVLTWQLAEHFELGAEVFLNYGAGVTEFGLFPVRATAVLKLRYYL